MLQKKLEININDNEKFLHKLFPYSLCYLFEDLWNSLASKFNLC
jgi:hypothetical protein